MRLAEWIAHEKTERDAYRFTSFKSLAALPFRPAPQQPVSVDWMPSLDKGDFRHRLVFVDGRFRADLCLFGALSPSIISGTDEDGYRLSLNADTCLALTPLELLFITTAAPDPVTSHVALHIEVGASGRLTIIDHHISLGAGAPHAATFAKTIALGPHAKLIHAKLQRQAHDHIHLASTHAYVAAGAYYDNFTLLAGGAMTRNDINVILQEPQAQVRLQGLMLQRGAQQADTTTRITHAAPDTQSREIYKSVVDDRAKTVFQGKIVVEAEAQRTDGHQLSRGLMLSDAAEINAKPELEIYADDVKCSHGSTIGQLDADALFYLRSRGVSAAAARALLVRAFAEDMIDQITVPTLQTGLRLSLDEWLEVQHDKKTVTG